MAIRIGDLDQVRESQLTNEDLFLIEQREGTKTIRKDELMKPLINKVDKVEGKGLSTNDYTSVDKAEVSKIKELSSQLDNIALNIHKYIFLVTGNDWTSAFKQAIMEYKTNKIYSYLYLPSGEYVIKETITIDFNGFKIKGAGKLRHTDKGVVNGNSTSIISNVNGDLFAIGDSSITGYNGYQSCVFEDLHIKYGGSTTSKLNNPTSNSYNRADYGTSSKAISDYRGGSHTYKNLTIENFENGIYSIYGDVSIFDGVDFNYNKIGLLGDNIPQNAINNSYCIGNDTVIKSIGSTLKVDFNNLILVKNGSVTDNPIILDYFSNAITLNNCWFEDHNNSNYPIMRNFISIGETSGQSTDNIVINNSTLICAYTNYFVSIGRGKNISLNNVTGKPIKRMVEFSDGATRDCMINLQSSIYSDGVHYEVNAGYEPTVKTFIKGEALNEKNIVSGYLNTNTITTQPATNTLINFDTTTINYKSQYNPTNGVFTAYEDGYYLVNAHVQFTKTATYVELGYNWNGSGGIYHILAQKQNVSGLVKIGGANVIKMNKGNMIQLKIISDAALDIGKGSQISYFTISKF